MVQATKRILTSSKWLVLMRPFLAGFERPLTIQLGGPYGTGHMSSLGRAWGLAWDRDSNLYVAQTVTASAWGLTPLEDQQLAGVIMWVPAGTIYAGAALALTAIWIKQTTERARQTDAACAI